MSDEGDLNFEPVNLGQSLGVLADVVGVYISNSGSEAIQDKTKLAQLSLTIFLHNLLMASKHKAKMADILDLLSIELREAAKAEAPLDTARSDSPEG